MTQSANRTVVLLVLLALLSVGSPSRAEMYVAGQVGASIPNKFSNVEGVDTLSGLKLSDLSLQNSFMYGAKLGYYFDSVKWLGLETEVFNTNPNLKQQNVTVSGAGGGSASGSVIGQHVRVLNWAPINIVVRYPGERFQPYAGVGMGVFFARLHDSASGESSSDNWRVGLNTQLGLRFLLTQHVSLFGEWKYNRASFTFSDSTPTAATGGLKGDYSAHILAFGLGYHF